MFFGKIVKKLFNKDKKNDKTKKKKAKHDSVTVEENHKELVKSGKPLYII